MLATGMLTNLHANLNKMNRFQNQIASERKILRLSDDPIGSIKAMQIETKLVSNEQYERNIADASAWINQTDSILMDINNVLLQAKDLATQAATDTYSDEQKSVIAEEIKQLQNHFLSLANTSFAGRYLFGGFNTTSAPFTANGEVLSYNSISDLKNAVQADIDAEASQTIQYRLSDSVIFDVSTTGIEIMGSGEDNIFNYFQGLINCLNSPGSDDSATSYIAKFSSAQDRILKVLADVGGRQIRLDLITQRYESENLNLYETLDKTAGIDKAEVITYYEMARTAYNAALQVGAQIIQLSLADFLR